MAAVLPYGFVLAVLAVLVMAAPVVGVLATASALAAVTAGRGRRR